MHARIRTRLRRRRSPKNKKGKPTQARSPGPWPFARAAALFPTPLHSLTASVHRWSQGRDASESMGALSTLTIGSSALHARVRGAKERLAAAHATAQAGCTPAARDSAPGRTRGNHKGQALSDGIRFALAFRFGAWSAEPAASPLDFSTSSWPDLLLRFFLSGISNSGIDWAAWNSSRR